ncbi:MAG: hypothetical protein ACFCBU_16535 [Cyanophyceae cyanobacterium]
MTFVPSNRFFRAAAIAPTVTLGRGTWESESHQSSAMMEKCQKTGLD